MPPMDTDPLQTPADADDISGRSKNACVRTSLVCRGGALIATATAVSRHCRGRAAQLNLNE